MWESSSSVTVSYTNFVAEIRKVFNHPVRVRDASKHLLSHCQGSHSIAEFSVEFRTFAAESGWDDEALKGFYFKRHQQPGKRQVSSYG